MASTSSELRLLKSESATKARSTSAKDVWHSMEGKEGGDQTEPNDTSCLIGLWSRSPTLPC